MRLIDADDLKEYLEECRYHSFNLDDAIHAVDDAPTVDSPIIPDGWFLIGDLKAWLYEVAINNTPSDFEKAVVEIINRLDGFERFCKEVKEHDVS